MELEKLNYEKFKCYVEGCIYVEMINVVIWNKNVWLCIIDWGMGKWGFMVKEVFVEDELDVEVIIISSILNKFGFDRIGLLKIDIEGFE